MSDEAMTVGDLRKVLAGLPDDAYYQPEWADGPPGDDAPAVSVTGFAAKTDEDGKPYLSVLVGVAYLEDFESDDDDNDDDDD